MRNNCWIKKVRRENGESFYSIKCTEVNPPPSDNSNEPHIMIYPEVILSSNQEGGDNWSNDELVLYGMLQIYCNLPEQERYELKIHRTKFKFKNNPNIMLNLDRVTFKDGNGCVIYSIYGDTLCRFFEKGISSAVISQKKQFSFGDDMKPCRSKIIQYLYGTESLRPVYSHLQEKGYVLSLDYVTISFFQYEAQRIRHKWEEFNKKFPNEKRSEEFINFMEAAALVGRTSITYEDDDGNENPYYSDDEEEEENC